MLKRCVGKLQLELPKDVFAKLSLQLSMAKVGSSVNYNFYYWRIFLSVTYHYNYRQSYFVSKSIENLDGKFSIHFDGVFLYIKGMLVRKLREEKKNKREE